jgi:hypothetical protein
MERRQIHPPASYSFIKRRCKQKSIYYARFRDPGSGQRLSAISTGCTRQDDAIRWCENHLEERTRAEEEAKEKTQHITFAEFARDFWSTEGAYAQSRVAHLFTCSRGYLDIAESNTRNHLLPAWGSCRLKDLSPGKIDRWVVRLCRDGTLAPATVNKLLQTLRTILGRAVADGWLSENPAAYVKPVKALGAERGILTPEEVARLLSDSSIWEDYQPSCRDDGNANGRDPGAMRGKCEVRQH